MVRLYGNIKPKKILGLTATPFRSDKLAIPFDQTIRETNIFQLIRDNFLSDFEHYSIEKWTPELVTNAYLSDRKHWGKSVMFFHTEAECREAEARLLDANVRCDVVTAKTNREQQLDEFDDDNLDVLINMLILTEGFDCPNLETVFVRPSNKNATVQMCGRVLRKFQGIQKKIVQCQNTKHPFCNYAPSKYRYTWEDQKWIALNTNFRHELIKDQMISILSQCYVDKDTLDKISGISAYSRRQVDRIFQILEEEDKEEAKKIEMIEQKKRIDEVMSKILSMTPSQKSENSNSNVIQLDSRGYTLNEDLIACRWIAENVDVSTIARRLGRASTNIRYRYKDKIRGIGPIFAEKGFQGLYELYKLDYSEQDLIDRLISFERILINQ
jgi:superfamily II DNA/RNA helicase